MLWKIVVTLLDSRESSGWQKLHSHAYTHKRSITVEGQAKEAVCQVFAKAREGGGKGDWVQESNVGD
jgi:hypothetical protein